MVEYNVSVIIPVYNLNSYRLKNFILVLNKLLESSAYEVIVVDQIPEKYKGSQSINKIAYHEKYKYFQYISEEGNIQKSKLINYGVSKCSSEYICMVDADIFFPYSEVFSKIDGSNAIQPFEYFVNLNKKDSNEFHSSSKVEFAKSDSKIQCFSAGSFIMKKDFFEEIGGFDERYTGWGWEDREFQDRVRRNTSIKVLDGVGIHLYHDKSIPSSSNSSLYMESLKENVDTALVYITYKLDGLRYDATMRAFKEIKKQTLPCHRIWVELLFDEEESILPTVEKETGLEFQHILVRANDSNRDLFQKEALMNIAVKNLDKKYRNIIFMDSDVYSMDHDWLLDVRNNLSCQENMLCQGGEDFLFLNEKRTDYQTNDPSMWKVYKEAGYVFTHACFNPGICMGMTRNLWEEMDGLNPFGIMFYGDTICCAELFGNNAPRYYVDKLRHTKFIGSILRDLDIKFTFTGTSHTVIHEYHGPVKKFDILYKFLMNLEVKVKDYVDLDDQGLLYWKKDFPLFRHLYKVSRTIETEDDLFREILKVSV